MRTCLSILLTIAVAAAAAPAAAQNREHQQMAAELRIMQEQSQQLALALAQLSDAIKGLNGTIGETQEANVRRFAGIENAIKGIASDLNAMRTRTDETNVLIRALSEDIEALRKTLLELPGRLTQIVTPPAPVDPNDPAAVAAGPPPQAPVGPLLDVGQTPTRAFETAFGDYGAGQFDLAISGFEQFIKQFPMSERAVAAQFYIGEAHSAMNRFQEALTAYDAVMRNYQKGTYVAQATFKRGVTQQRLGMTDAARASFEQVIKNYPPNEPAVGLAQQRLASLPAPPKPTK